MSWSPIDVLPGGHRLFRRDGSSNIYIADKSGKNPASTDDEPMWLDFQAPIRVSKKNEVTVSVETDSAWSADYRVPISMADALVLSDKYAMTIQCAVGGSFRAVRTR